MKDINEGDIVRIRGIIYKVICIEKSPYILGKGIDVLNFTLEYIEDDLGEKLADLANGDKSGYELKNVDGRKYWVD